VQETGEGMQDGFWEVGYVLRRLEGGKLLEGTRDLGDAEKTVIRAMGDAVKSAVGVVEGGVKAVRCMDVWAAVFERT
jgi:hypothetical protein